MRCATARIGTLWLLAPALAGCQTALVGDWHLARATPNREVFALEDVSFVRDGGYAATATLDGRTARETGKYQFTGLQLVLRPSAGGERRYGAQLKWSQLHVRRGSSLVVLEKGKSQHAAAPPPREPPPAGNEHGAAAATPTGPPANVIHEGAPPESR